MAKLQTDSSTEKKKLETIKKGFEHFRHPTCGDFICIRKDVWDKIWGEWING